MIFPKLARLTKLEATMATNETSKRSATSKFFKSSSFYNKDGLSLDSSSNISKETQEIIIPPPFESSHICTDNPQFLLSISISWELSARCVF